MLPYQEEFELQSKQPRRRLGIQDGKYVKPNVQELYEEYCASQVITAEDKEVLDKILDETNQTFEDKNMQASNESPSEKLSKVLDDEISKGKDIVWGPDQEKDDLSDVVDDIDNDA